MTDLIPIRGWIEQITGTRVESLERLAEGSSRGMFVVRRAGASDLILRMDVGAGPVAGTELSLAREAEAYRALSGRPVAVPRFYGITPDGAALLVERARGGYDLAALDSSQRARICDRYIDALAALHRIDSAALDLPSFRRPATATDHALQELDLWHTIFRERVTRPAVLAHRAFAILRELAPAYTGPTVLCHGDVGPKNFLFEDGEITALIDWEFAHLGDPMDDLAWWIFRGHEWLGAGGSLPDQLRRWSAASGLPLDARRIAYYRALILLRWSVMVVGALDSGGAAMDRSNYLSLIPVLDVKLACALAGLLDENIGPYPEPPRAQPPLGGEVGDIVRAEMHDFVLPALVEPEARRRATAVLNYAAHLTAIDRLGAAIRADDLADLSGILGETPVDAAEGERRLGDASAADVLRYCMRKGARHAELWPAIRERALAPPWSPGSLGIGVSDA